MKDKLIKLKIVRNTDAYFEVNLELNFFPAIINCPIFSPGDAICNIISYPH